MPSSSPVSLSSSGDDSVIVVSMIVMSATAVIVAVTIIAVPREEAVVHCSVSIAYTVSSE